MYNRIEIINYYFNGLNLDKVISMFSFDFFLPFRFVSSGCQGNFVTVYKRFYTNTRTRKIKVQAYIIFYIYQKNTLNPRKFV